MADYAAQTKAQLEQEADSRGIDVPSGATKAQIVSLLEQDDAQQEADQPTEQAAQEEEQPAVAETPTPGSTEEGTQSPPTGEQPTTVTEQPSGTGGDDNPTVAEGVGDPFEEPEEGEASDEQKEAQAKQEEQQQAVNEVVKDLNEYPRDLLVSLRGTIDGILAGKGTDPTERAAPSTLEVASRLPVQTQSDADMGAAAGAVDVEEDQVADWVVRQETNSAGQPTGPAYAIVVTKSGEKKAAELEAA